MPDDRDEYRPKTPPSGVRTQTAPPVEFVAEEATGRVDLGQDERREIRRRRDPSASPRVEHLEERVDGIENKVDTLVATVSKIDGKLEVVPELVELLRNVIGGKVAGANAELTATLKINEAKAADEIEGNKERRARWAKTWTQILAGAGIAGTAILAAIQARGC